MPFLASKSQQNTRIEQIDWFLASFRLTVRQVPKPGSLWFRLLREGPRQGLPHGILWTRHRYIPTSAYAGRNDVYGPQGAYADTSRQTFPLCAYLGTLGTRVQELQAFSNLTFLPSPGMQTDV
eukprot:3082018-Rhodomonas_salina.1